MMDRPKLEEVINGLQDVIDREELCIQESEDAIVAAIAMTKALSAFKECFDDLYGQGLEIINWHMNGETEPFDNFYESALEAGTQWMTSE